MASKFIPPLSVKEIGELPIGTHNVGGVPGLYLRKLPNKSCYYFQYTENGKRRDLYLGTYSKLTLAQARLKATAAKSMVEQGISPVEAAKTTRICKTTQRQQLLATHTVISFEKVAKEWFSERLKAGYWAENRRGESHTIRLLELYAFQLIGSKLIGKITPEHIWDCLAPIWKTKPSCAKKLKTHLTKIFQWLWR